MSSPLHGKHEKPDVLCATNQTSSFDAERQAFYDNEQHLKSRIQSLTQARKRAEAEAARAAEALTPVEPAAASDAQSVNEPGPIQRSSSQKTDSSSNDPDNEPAEMTALKLELSTLSTSYASMQSTLVLLQSQLVDLKRVNQEVQEENESYMILLREKTLSGQFDLMRQVGGNKSSSDEDSEDDERGTSGDLNSLHSTARSTLDRVDEEPEIMPDGSGFGHDLEAELARSSPVSSKPPSRGGRRRTTSTSAPRGESLADLPVAGPGLDLAAELGRAENKDILEGNLIEEDTTKAKRSRKASDSRKDDEFEALRSEVKNLKDANKALSLYASKIIDRIIAQEGFEHVLAADYDADAPKTPATASTAYTTLPKGPAKASPAKPRPQSVFVGRTASNPPPPTTLATATPPPAPTTRPSNPKRRSLSFDWKTFSFSSVEKPQPSPNLRQLTLQPGASPVVTSARKLETTEDEEDRKERERLTATMKLMGIQPQSSIHSPGLAPPPRIEETKSEPPPSQGGLNRRFSLWGKPPALKDNSDTASNRSTESSRGLGLTHEVLEHVEAENSLAALDAREKNLSQEIAKGGSGGFTEPQRRSIGRRSRRSVGGSGSGSTVFSAGMNDD